MQLLSELPIDVFDNPRDGDIWARSPLAVLSDAHLIATCVSTITPPKIAKPSSFVLHAPLELLARAALLPFVAPEARAQARRRIAEVAVRYAHAGAAVETPVILHANIDAAHAALRKAMHGGDAIGADAALLYLLPRQSLSQLRAALTDEIAPLLGAAGHAPILWAALPRFANRIAGVGGLLRAPLRVLATAANIRLTWHETINATVPSANPAQVLIECLAKPVRVKTSSTSIAPMLLAVESNGVAARLLSDYINAPLNAISIWQTEKILLRIAALSMLQDDPVQAPYGWTHCLTLPQALLQNADVSKNHRALIAVAATHVLAYRAVFGSVKIDVNFVPAQTSLTNFLEAEPDTAASIVFHAFKSGSTSPCELKTQLATRAALHGDAHLAKYTLACFDAASNDPDAAPLFLAAAAFLGAWWRNYDLNNQHH